MSLASHAPIGIYDELDKLYQRILNNCSNLPFTTCETTRQYLESMGFQVVRDASGQHLILDGPVPKAMQVFHSRRDCKNVQWLRDNLTLPDSVPMYWWPAFLGVCDDLKKARDENADLRRQCSGVRLQTQNTDLSKLLTSLSR